MSLRWLWLEPRQRCWGLGWCQCRGRDGGLGGSVWGVGADVVGWMRWLGDVCGQPALIYTASTSSAESISALVKIGTQTRTQNQNLGIPFNLGVH